MRNRFEFLSLKVFIRPPPTWMHCMPTITEDDWSSIQETLFLLSIPGLRESIRKGLATSVDDCAKELVW